MGKRGGSRGNEPEKWQKRVAKPSAPQSEIYEPRPLNPEQEALLIETAEENARYVELKEKEKVQKEATAQKEKTNRSQKSHGEGTPGR